MINDQCPFIREQCIGNKCAMWISTKVHDIDREMCLLRFLAMELKQLNETVQVLQGWYEKQITK